MDAYTAALTLLSRRELSAKQLRDRLLRRKFDADDVEAVIERLRADRTLDDRRVAVASARMEAAIKGRGRRRVLQHVQHLGVSADVAQAAVDEVFSDVDESALLERAIEKRLKGTSIPELDVRGKARLVRQLVGHGFEPSRVFARLRKKGVDGDE
jgi:regulatory protein